MRDREVLKGAMLADYGVDSVFTLYHMFYSLFLPAPPPPPSFPCCVAHSV